MTSSTGGARPGRVVTESRPHGWRHFWRGWRPDPDGDPVGAAPPSLVENVETEGVPANPNLLVASFGHMPAGYWVESAPPGRIKLGGIPVTEFLPGWRAKYVYAGFFPVYLLELENLEGQRATWFLDDDMNRVGGEVQDLTAEHQEHVVRCVEKIVNRLWADIFAVAAVPQDKASEVAAFFAINDYTRRALVDLHYGVGRPPSPVGLVSELDASYRRFMVSGDRGPVMLDADCLRATLTRSIADENRRLCTEGEFHFPSPVDGRELPSEHGLYLDDNIWAYKVADPVQDYNFLIIACESKFRTIAMYFPRDHLVLCLDSFHQHIVETRIPHLTHRLYQHVGLYGDVLPAYFRQKTEQAMHVLRGANAMHIGHSLWNDLAGMTRLIEAVPQLSLPKFAVFDTPAVPEMYGPLERIFPEIEGRVVRYDRSFIQCIPEFYTAKFRLLKAATDFVTASVRDRILAAAEGAPENQAVRAAADVARHGPDLIVYINVRVENRTLSDPAAFCEALVDFFASQARPATLIIDGHDRRLHDDPRWMYASVGEHTATRDPISIEHEIAGRMRARAAGTRVSVVSTVGSTIAQSLLWCRSAHFFVATWGAALAKCRWVCNKPGLVLSSRVNLTSTGDLLIYSSEQYNENPAPIRFIDPLAVTDRPGAAQILAIPGNFHVNFDIDMKILHDTIFEMIQAHS